MSSWYAVQSRSHCEARVFSHLTQKSIPAFLPFMEVVHYYPTRRIKRLEPLFPGYLFARFEMADGNPELWNAVRWTPGVKMILSIDGAPVPVPNGVIEAIQARVQDLGFVRPGFRFAANDRVVIRRGPLAGLEAVFDRPLSRSGRVRVLMRLLGQERAVQVDTADLELA
jgi:transcriptional antiterminator RfaH